VEATLDEVLMLFVSFEEKVLLLVEVDLEQ